MGLGSVILTIITAGGHTKHNVVSLGFELQS